MVEEKAYCLKCKKKVNSEGKVVTLKTKHGKRGQFKGKCPKCGTKVCKFVSLEK